MSKLESSIGPDQAARAATSESRTSRLTAGQRVSMYVGAVAGVTLTILGAGQANAGTREICTTTERLGVYDTESDVAVRAVAQLRSKGARISSLEQVTYSLHDSAAGHEVCIDVTDGPFGSTIDSIKATLGHSATVDGE